MRWNWGRAAFVLFFLVKFALGLALNTRRIYALDKHIGIHEAGCQKKHQHAAKAADRDFSVQFRLILICHRDLPFITTMCASWLSDFSIMHLLPQSIHQLATFRCLISAVPPWA